MTGEEEATCIPAGFMDVWSHVRTVHFYFTDRGGCWILQNTGAEFSPKQVAISGNPGLSGLGVEAGCRHAPHSCMLTHITRIQVTQFHILPVQTLSINTQSEKCIYLFIFLKKERLETTHGWGGGWLCSCLNALRRILSFMLPVINMIITTHKHVI